MLREFAAQILQHEPIRLQRVPFRVVIIREQYLKHHIAPNAPQEFLLHPKHLSIISTPSP